MFTSKSFNTAHKILKLSQMTWKVVEINWSKAYITVQKV